MYDAVITLGLFRLTSSEKPDPAPSITGFQVPQTTSFNTSVHCLNHFKVFHKFQHIGSLYGCFHWAAKTKVFSVVWLWIRRTSVHIFRWYQLPTCNPTG